MESKEVEYRIKVNKEYIDSFFAKPASEATNKEIAEVNKVITIVMNRYYGKYYRMFKELRSWAMLAIIERHKNYDPQWSAYNYVYRISRNEIGNKISKFIKEEYLDVLPEYGSYSSSGHDFDSIEQLIPYLSGEKSFGVLDVPKDMIFPLLVFVEESLHRSTKDLTYLSVANILIQVNYE